MTWVAREAFAAMYSGDRVEIALGERLADDHPLAAVPECRARLEHVDDERLVADPTQNGHAAPARSASGGGAPRRQLTASQQGAIRTARLRELEAREAEGWGVRQEAHDAFWAGANDLLLRTQPRGNGLDGLGGFDYRQEAEDRRINAENERLVADFKRSTVESLSEWLDR